MKFKKWVYELSVGLHTCTLYMYIVHVVENRIQLYIIKKEEFVGHDNNDNKNVRLKTTNPRNLIHGEAYNIYFFALSRSDKTFRAKFALLCNR